LVKGPVGLSKLFSNSTPVNNCQNGALSDPTVLFDKANHRWVITFLAATSGGPIGFKAPFYQCIAVSKTDDATGSYWLYSFDGLLPIVWVKTDYFSRVDSNSKGFLVNLTVTS
jgi:hypothetical protein